MKNTLKLISNPFLFVLGSLFLILGIIGAFLPIMPTVPFVLVSTYCFSKSSPRIHRWILSVPYFGEGVRDWEENGVIKKRTKIIATLALIASMFIMFYLQVKEFVLMVVGIIFLLVLAFIWTRPSLPPKA